MSAVFVGALGPTNQIARTAASSLPALTSISIFCLETSSPAFAKSSYREGHSNRQMGVRHPSLKHCLLCCPTELLFRCPGVWKRHPPEAKQQNSTCHCPSIADDQMNDITIGSFRSMKEYQGLGPRILPSALLGEGQACTTSVSICWAVHSGFRRPAVIHD